MRVKVRFLRGGGLSCCAERLSSRSEAATGFGLTDRGEGVLGSGRSGDVSRPNNEPEGALSHLNTSLCWRRGLLDILLVSFPAAEDELRLMFSAEDDDDEDVDDDESVGCLTSMSSAPNTTVVLGEAVESSFMILTLLGRGGVVGSLFGSSLRTGHESVLVKAA